MLADVGAADHFLRNNLAFSGTSIANANLAEIDAAFNSWNGGVTVSSADFLSLNSTGTDGARQADGSLPFLNFLRLAAGSDLIDNGVNVGLPFSGAAPDLGAFEYVPEPTSTPLISLLIGIGLRRQGRFNLQPATGR